MISNTMRPLAVWLFVVISCSAQEAVFPAADPHCPKYPESLRTRWNAAQQRQLAARDWRKAARPLPAAAINLPRNNFIDEILFARMSADGVTPAPPTTDYEFVRRAHI